MDGYVNNMSWLMWSPRVSKIEMFYYFFYAYRMLRTHFGQRLSVWLKKTLIMIMISISKRLAEFWLDIPPLFLADFSQTVRYSTPYYNCVYSHPQSSRNKC